MSTKAAAALPGATRDDDALTLDVPSDGGFGSVRTVMDRLDRWHVEARALTIHTPDLDDVFFALTGHDTTPTEAPLDSMEVAR